MDALDLASAPGLNGKRILISGGGQGLGHALALAFQADGAQVAICARHETNFTAFRQGGGLAYVADVSDPRSVERMIHQLAEAWGRLDVLVNNAAVFRPERLIEMSLAHWREVIDVNLHGAYHLIRSALWILPQGNIVNITSGLGRFPMQPYGAYCVSKAGLNMLTRALAEELRDRCRVNAIDPGEVRTRMNPVAREHPSAVVPVARALVGLAPGGPTGRCYRKDGTAVPWE